MPQPETQHAVPGEAHLTFTPAREGQAQVIRLRAKVQHLGKLHGSISAGGETLVFQQFAYP